jgi:hypothetical protein
MKVIDYLQQEIDAAEERKEATKTRKNGKHGRVVKMVKKLATMETPIPVLDFLGD